MKNIAKVLMLLALAAIICMPVLAMADYTMSSSFGYNWTDPGLGNGQPDPNFKYDQFNTSLTAGSVAFSSALYGTNYATISLTDAMWAGSFTDATHSTAFGGPEKGIGQMQWDYNFAGDPPPGPYTIKIDYFDKGVLLGYELYNINGHSYEGSYHPIPLPPSALLMATGLLGLVGLRRFKKS
jgi:hypothetical protein